MYVIDTIMTLIVTLLMKRMYGGMPGSRGHARPDRKETRIKNFDFLLDMYTKTGVPLEHIVKDVNGAKPACSL